MGLVTYRGRERELDGDIRLNGTDIDLVVGGALAGFDEELRLDGSPTVRVTIVDPFCELERSGLLDLDNDSEDKLGREVELIVDGVAYWLRQVVRDPREDTVELVFEDRTVCLLRDTGGTMKISPNTLDVQGFIRRLCEKAQTPPLITDSMTDNEIDTARKKARLGSRTRRDEEKREAAARKLPGFGDTKGLKVKGQQMTPHQRAEATVLMTEGLRLRAPELALVSMVFAAIGESSIGGSADAYSANSSGYGGVMGASAKSWNLRDTRGMARAFMLGGAGFHDGAIKLSRSISNPEEIAVRVERPSIWPDNAYAHQIGYDRFLPEAKEIVAAFLGGELDLTTSYTTTTRREAPLTVDRGETYWDSGRRTAETYGSRFFVVANQPYFFTDTALFAQAPVMTIANPRHPDADPSRTQGVIGIGWEWAPRKQLRRTDLEINVSERHAPPGSCVLLDETCGPAGSDKRHARRGRWVVGRYERSRFDETARIELQKGRRATIPVETDTRSFTVGGSTSTGSYSGTVVESGGAKGIVDQIAQLAAQVGGAGVYVGSGSRPGSTTTSGNPSDHSSNDAHQAARDIGVRNINLLIGPPSPKLDKAVVEIGKVFGRSYSPGTTIIDTFTWRGWRVQIIWRTPLYGGHMGHIHIGVRRA